MKKIIQNIVLDKIEPKLILIQKNLLISTKTYFNILNIKLLKRITKIDFFFCHLTVSGRGELQIVAVRNNKEFNFYSVTITKHEVIEIKLDNDNDYYYIVFSNTINIIQAYYFTETPNYFAAKIAIVVTTYNRINDIELLVENYKLIKSNPNLTNIDLIIINNGENLPIDENGFKIINTLKNIGGAGGFKKGIKFALESKMYSHIILSDDDAFFCEETIIRTEALLSLLNLEYSDAILSGSMFYKENPIYCHTAIEGLSNRLFRVNVLGDIELTSTNIIPFLNSLHYHIVNNEHNLTKYAAWWFAAIPVQTINLYGLPKAGYFFRADDQEYGLRTKSKIINNNGICVWHPNFISKKNYFRTYLGVRNSSINNLCYNSSFRSTLFKSFMINFYRDFISKDTRQIRARVLALNDINIDVNKAVDGDTLRNKVTKYCEKRSNILLLYFYSIFKLFKFLLISFITNKKI